MHNLPPVFIGVDIEALPRNMENAAFISLAIMGGLKAVECLERRDFSVLSEDTLNDSVAAFERVIMVCYGLPNVAEA